MIDNVSTLDISSYGGVGVLLPLVIAFLNRPTFPTWLRGLIMLIISIIAGMITYGLKNEWDFTSGPAVLTAVIGVVAATQVAYHALWQPNGIAGKIETNINSGSTPTPAHAATEADHADQDIEEDTPDEDEIDQPDESVEYAPEEGDDTDAYVDADAVPTR